MLTTKNIKMGYRVHDQGYHDCSTVLAVQDDGVIVSREDGLHFYTFVFLNENNYDMFNPETVKMVNPFRTEKRKNNL